jgi:hypothetical protein
MHDLSREHLLVSTKVAGKLEDQEKMVRSELSLGRARSVLIVGKVERNPEVISMFRCVKFFSISFTANLQLGVFKIQWVKVMRYLPLNIKLTKFI